MSLGHSIRANTRWILAGNLATRVFGFAIGVVLARLLVPADFGLLVTIQVFTGMASFIAAGGMGEALVQAREAHDRDFHVVFTLQLTICLLIYATFFLLSPWFATWYGEPRYEDLMRVSALNFLVRPFATLPKAHLKRAMRFKVITITTFGGMTAGSLLSIALAALGFGPWALVLGGLSGAVLNAIALNLVVRKPFAFHYERETARRLGGYGIRMSLNEIIVYLRQQTANFILGRLSGPALVGLYNKGESLSQLPGQIILSSTYQTVFRGLAKVQDDLAESRRLFHRTLTLTALYALPFYTALAFLAEPFIVGIYGEKWRAASAPLAVLAVAGMLRCITNAAGAVSAARNRLGREVRIQIETWILRIVGCIAGWPWGITGVAIGTIPGLVWLTYRLGSLANHSLGTGWREIVAALLPPIALNGVLVLALVILEQALPAGWRDTHPLFFLALMGVGGTLAYGLALLYAPLPALTDEANRWRVRLHLPRR